MIQASDIMENTIQNIEKVLLLQIVIVIYWMVLNYHDSVLFYSATRIIHSFDLLLCQNHLSCCIEYNPFSITTILIYKPGIANINIRDE